MDDNDKAQGKFKVTTADGSSVDVKCPVCGNDTFGSAGPTQDERRLGFQHVIAGREIEGGTPGRVLTSPVRFQFCMRCGFILKFMFLDAEKQWGDDET